MAKFFGLLTKVGHVPDEWLVHFKRGAVQTELEPRQRVAAFLRTLSGHRKVSELSRELGVSRYIVSRWLSGQTEITLPDFLRLVEVLTLSALDLVALLTDPEELDACRRPWQLLVAARRSALEKPWSHAIAQMVDLPSYRTLARHEPGWFASRLGISVTEENECLALLVALGRLVVDEGLYRSTSVLTVDTRPDPEATRQLAAFWMRKGVERVVVPGGGRFAFNLFGIAQRDLERLRELQSRYFAELRSIVAESEPTEAVVVATFQLFTLAEETPVD
jgi:transcriptional regulator with XRE-family HTH domain